MWPLLVQGRMWPSFRGECDPRPFSLSPCQFSGLGEQTRSSTTCPWLWLVDRLSHLSFQPSLKSLYTTNERGRETGRGTRRGKGKGERKKGGRILRRVCGCVYIQIIYIYIYIIGTAGRHIYIHVCRVACTIMAWLSAWTNFISIQTWCVSSFSWVAAGQLLPRLGRSQYFSSHSHSHALESTTTSCCDSATRLRGR